MHWDVFATSILLAMLGALVSHLIIDSKSNIWKISYSITGCQIALIIDSYSGLGIYIVSGLIYMLVRFFVLVQELRKEMKKGSKDGGPST